MGGRNTGMWAHHKEKDEEMEDFHELIWSSFEAILNEKSKV